MPIAAEVPSAAGPASQGRLCSLTMWPSGLGTGLQSPARGFDSRLGL